MKKLINVLIAILIFATMSVGQENEQNKKTIYKNAKVHLKSGKVLKCKKLTVHDSTITFSVNDSTHEVLKRDVTSIKVSKGNHSVLGGIAGGALAFAVTILINETGDVTTHTTQTTTYSYESGQQHASTSAPVTEVEKTLSGGQILSIVAGGALFGAIIGYLNKADWQKLNFHLSPQKRKTDREENASYHIQLNNRDVVDGVIKGVSEEWIYVLKSNETLIKIKKDTIKNIYGKHHYKYTKQIFRRQDLKITDDVFPDAVTY